MNKQFVISVVALFVVTMLGGMVVHGMILADDCSKLASVVLDIIVLVVVGIVTAFVNRDPVAARA